LRFEPPSYIFNGFYNDPIRSAFGYEAGTIRPPVVGSGLTGLVISKGETCTILVVKGAGVLSLSPFGVSAGTE
jgi:hypothetical protein